MRTISCICCTFFIFVLVGVAYASALDDASYDANGMDCRRFVFAPACRGSTFKRSDGASLADNGDEKSSMEEQKVEPKKALFAWLKNLLHTHKVRRAKHPNGMDQGIDDVDY